MNIIILKGRLTRDVEIKTTQNNLTIGKFSLAVNDNYKDNKKTYFFNVTSFGKLAENISKFFSKGSEILINGKIVQNTWQDKDGHKRQAVEVIANGFDFCGSKASAESNSAETVKEHFNGTISNEPDDAVNFDDVDGIDFGENNG